MRVSPRPATPPTASVALILDASGSMHARLPSGGIAHRRGPEGREGRGRRSSIRMRSWGCECTGRKSPASEKNCEDSYLAVPLAPAAKAGPEIQKAVDGVKAQGWTPIAYSLEQAAADFPAAAKERAIVLVSDGKETCKGDPSWRRAPLGARGIVIHTIGYAVDSAARCSSRASRARAAASTSTRPTRPSSRRRSSPRWRRAGRKPAAIPTGTKPGKLRTTGASGSPRIRSIDATGKEVGSSTTRAWRSPSAGRLRGALRAQRVEGHRGRPGETTTHQPRHARDDART
jgi:hypothetical protein